MPQTARYLYLEESFGKWHCVFWCQMKCVFSRYSFQLLCSVTHRAFKTNLCLFLTTAFFLLTQTSFSHFMILFVLNSLPLLVVSFVFFQHCTFCSTTHNFQAKSCLLFLFACLITIHLKPML